MKQIKNITWILVPLAVLIVLVMVRTFNRNLFKRSAADALVAPTMNTVSENELQSVTDDYIVVELDGESGKYENSISVPYDRILDKTNRRQLEQIEGNIFLYSESIESAAQAWIIMNQLGFDNIFILSNEGKPEAFKYKFQPDTTVGPEL